MLNPLTRLERANIRNLILHDLKTYIDDFLEKNITSYKTVHVTNSLTSLSLLSDDSQCSFERTDKQRIDQKLKEIKSTFFSLENIVVENLFEPEIFTQPRLVYSAIYGVISERLYTQNGDFNMRIKLKDFEGKAKDLFYQCPETDVEGRFLKIEVTDQGRPLYLTPHKKIRFEREKNPFGNEGVGIYFAKTICKYLRGHLEITSEPGNTNVTIYHPLMLSN